MAADQDREREAREKVAACVTPEGGLDDVGWYLHWRPDLPWARDKATLDGRFSAAELRAIADHMERTQESTAHGQQ